MRGSARQWLLLAAALLAGTAVGVCGFTFVYARGYSYLTHDPAACANCHIMHDHFNSWLKSSHSKAADCNDCHTPSALVPKYATKARNGFWHSFYFTTGNFPEPLRITPRNHEIVERACRDCHAALTASLSPDREGFECIHCHRYAGHWVR